MTVTRKNGKNAIKQKFISGGLKGVSAWAELCAQYARSFSPVRDDHLRPSIHADRPYMKGDLHFANKVGTNVEYARAHELGSGIHALNPADRELIVIEAGYWTGKSDKKALAFKWPGGDKSMPNYDPETDKFVFRRVYHPGVPAANEGEGYLRKALKETKDAGRRLFLSALAAELNT